MRQNIPVPAQETGAESAPPLLNLEELLYILFRHKWMIGICSALGLISAAIVFFNREVEYQSEAKLLVKYVLERSGIDPVAGGADVDSRERRYGSNVINVELEILQSWNLAEEVAEAVNDRFEAVKTNASNDEGEDDADPGELVDAGTVKSGIIASAERGSNVIAVSYRHKDPEIAVKVLKEFVTRYFDKHLEIHRSVGAFDLVAQQADQVRSRLRSTDDELKKLKVEAGIISLPDSMVSVTSRMQILKETLMQAEMELAEARELAGNERSQRANKETEIATGSSFDAMPSAEEFRRHGTLTKLLAELRNRNLALLVQFTPQNHLVIANEEQIAETENQIQELEEAFPSLAAVSNSSGRSQVAVEARIRVLNQLLDELATEGARLAGFETKIGELQRRKALEEEKYHYFSSTLEKVRIDETLDPSKIPNISIVQSPSAPMKVASESVKKIVVALAGGGFALGVGIALLIEMVLDRTVRRPLELESRLRIPLLLAIPDISKSDHLRLKGPKNGDHDGGGAALALEDSGEGKLSPWEGSHFLRPYTGAIRDRLACYFELNQMWHAPKLVALTGFSEGAGTTSLAVGLAAAFSELREGNVLLVDMNVGRAEADPLFRGKPTCSLTEALESTKDSIHFEKAAQDRLYLATVASSGKGSNQFVAKKLYDLMPGFRASDFDYIIFDMPPLGPTSPTLSMAGFMDKVLLVADADKTNRDVLKRRYEELVAAKADVSCVVNKTREHVPAWIH